jgi:predicted ATPase/DNA-binding CsgD family transcriptional regulator
MHGFVAALTSFVGRTGEVAEVAGLVERYRLVTVTGPGGVGKTRLAVEVARQVAGWFADGVWLVELAGVSEPTLVQAAVAVALGVRQAPGMPLLDSLAVALARRQLLLVLDNCEHVLGTVGELCAELLPAADDVRILATSREPVRVAGEARYRLSPLGLPVPDDRSGIGGSEAVELFTARARQCDPHFALSGESGPVVARLVRRLDGMPLAIELAAARVEELGLTQLSDRLDDHFALLASGGRLAAPRHRSLAATAEWSYELLDERERQVFRKLAVLPGPFTLEAADAVAGPDAGQAVLHLVGCSLLTPPQNGPDGRVRYLMLETLRAYGAGRLAEAGEQPEAVAALAGFAVGLAEEAAAGLETSAGEVAAARWLDAEDATVHHVLAWALEHDPPTAVRLAVALAPWWWVRGRWAPGYESLSAAAGYAPEGGPQWCAAQFWLGAMAIGFDHTVSLGHFDAARDALTGRPPSPLLCLTLNCRAICLANLGHVPEANAEIRRALALARQIEDPGGEATALMCLAITAYYSDDPQASLAWSRQAQQIDAASIPGWISRERSSVLIGALTEAGELAAAERASARGLDAARQAGALYDQSDCLLRMAHVALLAGRLPEARVQLREATEIAAQVGGNLLLLLASLDLCGHLCAQTQRPADAVTAWAAYAACERHSEMPGLPLDARWREEPLRKARHALGPAAARAAEERGAAMALGAAAEYVALLVGEDARQPPGSPDAPGLPRLSAREQELVTLVAQGRTDAQIAAQLYISVRTVRSHLDRIRDKTGCRRRADLTRLALQASLV